MIRTLSKQRGAAIVVALFLVALVAALATLMIERVQTDVRRTELMINSNQSYLYAQGSVAWAIDQLNNNWKSQKPNTVIDKTPIRSAVNHENGFTISAVIYDAQGYFNINNLSDTQYGNDFIHLLQVLTPNQEASSAQALTQAISHWLTPNTNNPALDEYYLKLTPSYRAPRHAMGHISELRTIKGITPALYAQLSPYLIALPEVTKINVNSAPIPVLMSLSPTLTVDSAKAIELHRQQSPFATTQQFTEFDIIKNNPVDGNKITVVSNYFLLQTDVTVGVQHLVLYTLLERKTKDAQSIVNILWQSKGM